MQQSKRNTLLEYWSCFGDYPFDIHTLASDCKSLLGHDGNKLTQDDFVKIYNGDFAGNWRDVAFAAEEGIAAVVADIPTHAEFLVAIFLLLCYSESAKRGVGDLQDIVDKFFLLICRNFDKGESSHRLALCRSLFE